MASIEGDDFERFKSEASNILKKTAKSIRESSTTKQLAIGTASGWTTGYITMKIGKTAAFAVGGGIILLQLAQHKGYIMIDWEKIKRNAEQASDRLEYSALNNNSWVNRVREFAFTNSCFAAGFLGGFLIGLAT